LPTSFLCRETSFEFSEIARIILHRDVYYRLGLPESTGYPTSIICRPHTTPELSQTFLIDSIFFLDVPSWYGGPSKTSRVRCSGNSLLALRGRGQATARAGTRGLACRSGRDGA